MRSSRTFERWTTIAALFVLISQMFLLSRPAGAAVGAVALLQPTPLVLKDGRIANVSIHLLPFEQGQGALAGDVASRLADLTAQLATDCFLTAQVIGHVSSREVAENETLEAHRLARSRADAVQASLIGGGLPAKSIASVWDWQFLVREPRATLWVFRLIQGEDCEGAPVDGNASELVAGNEAADQAVPAESMSSDEAPPAPEVARAPEPVDPLEPRDTTASAEAVTPTPAPAEHAGLSGVVASASAAEAKPATAAEVADAETAAGGDDAPAGHAPRAAAAEPEQAAMPAGPALDAVPTLTRPLPALSPAQPDQSPAASSESARADTAVAALDAMRDVARAQSAAPASPGAQQSARQEEDPERKGKVEWGQDGDVVITFATNSSYFPPGAERRLSTLLDRMSGGEPYRVQLEVGVSGSDTVVGANSPEEARRYNRWLAERRMGRVQEWLDQNAQDRQLEIEPAFVADDSSRRVVVRVSPAG